MGHRSNHKGPQEALLRLWLQQLNHGESQEILKAFTHLYPPKTNCTQLGILYLHNHHCIWNKQYTASLMYTITLSFCFKGSLPKPGFEA